MAVEFYLRKGVPREEVAIGSRGRPATEVEGRAVPDSVRE